MVRVVVRIARGVRVAGEIQPHPRPVLSELRSGHQAVDVVSVGIRALVGKKAFKSSGVGGSPIRSRETRRRAFADRPWGSEQDLPPPTAFQ